MAGALYLVATPIGNLKDLSARALEVLGAVSFVICEDTRHSGQLLSNHGIKKPLVSLPAFDEAARAGALAERIAAGEDAALVTDAGTPAISDPGEKLVALCLEQGVTVVPVPGPSALLAALSASGLPTGRFHFLGFLPRQQQEAAEMLAEVRPLRATLVLYESPQRLLETLQLLDRELPGRRGCVARELTKLHEEFVRGTLGELAARFTEPPKGELVILVEGAKGEARWSEERVRAGLATGLEHGHRLKELSKDLARASGWSASEIYDVGLSLSRGRERVPRRGG